MNVDFEAPRTWSREAQEILATKLGDTPPRIWFCKDPGRGCDGQPHDGVPYPHARGSQWPPPGMEWLVWALVSGRGSGKTRTAGEMVRTWARRKVRIALVAATGPDLRETMIEGESGLLALSEAAKIKVLWEPSKKRFSFIESGAIAYGYSAEEPDRLRGPQHHYAWLDEPAHYDNIDDVWDNLLMGLRLGRNPQAICSTTPLPVKWLKDLIKDDTTVLTRESTYVNLSNLAPTFAKKILSRYEGTRLGRQELHGDILEDVEGALWNWEMIGEAQVDDRPFLERIVVGVDPAGTSNRRSDETGIVVVGVSGRDVFVLEDSSGRYSPGAWAKKVSALYDDYGANDVIAETNYGGDMVRTTLRNADEFMHVTPVNSRRGKAIRAEPVVALYEQKRVHHMPGLNNLEEQMASWVPSSGQASPDRLDALVHAITSLVKFDRPTQISSPVGKRIIRSDSHRYSNPLPRAMRSVASQP